MSTQAIFQTRISSRCRPNGVLMSLGLCFGIGLVAGMGTEASAAKMAATATNAPLKYPTYLDDQGQILSASNSTHSLAAKDKSRAAYVAFKLQNGASVSKTIPMMKAKAPIGSDAKQAIATVTSGVGKMAVRTQRGLFLVHNYHAQQAVASRKASPSHKAEIRSAAGNRKVSTSHIAVKAQHLSGTSSVTSGILNLNKLFDFKAAQNSLASSPLGKLLKFDSSSTTAQAENLHIAPTPSTSADSTLTPVGVHESPVPEPGTWAFAALAIGGMACREGLRRRRRASAVSRLS